MKFFFGHSAKINIWTALYSDLCTYSQARSSDKTSSLVESLRTLSPVEVLFTTKCSQSKHFAQRWSKFQVSLYLCAKCLLWEHLVVKRTSTGDKVRSDSTKPEVFSENTSSWRVSSKDLRHTKWQNYPLDAPSLRTLHNTEESHQGNTEVKSQSPPLRTLHIEESREGLSLMIQPT